MPARGGEMEGWEPDRITRPSTSDPRGSIPPPPNHRLLPQRVRKQREEGGVASAPDRGSLTTSGAVNAVESQKGQTQSF